MTTLHCDVVILGAGMVGASLAAALGTYKCKVILLDRQPLDLQLKNTQEAYANRVSAISRASQAFLHNIGAWDYIRQQRLCPYEHMHVWDATGDGVIHFDAAEAGASVLGHIIENDVIVKALHHALSPLQHVEMRAPVHASAIHTDEEQAILHTDQGNIHCKLIVGADGSRSWLREQLHIESHSWPYQQSAIVATVSISGSHESTAWQRFLPTGPLAFLPLPNGQCSIVWSNSNEVVQQRFDLCDEDFIMALNQAIGDTPLGKVTAIEQRGLFPLTFKHAEEYIGRRCALIGDAAHTIHPLAGQGVNLGFMDSATLAEEIILQMQKRKDIGSQQLLKRYQRRRKGENWLMLGGVDGIKRLFSNDDERLSLLRNNGIKLVNQLKPLKLQFMQHAMGYNNAVPKTLCHQDIL